LKTAYINNSLAQEMLKARITKSQYTKMQRQRRGEKIQQLRAKKPKPIHHNTGDKGDGTKPIHHNAGDKGRQNHFFLNVIIYSF
jgi:hypothetical protein